MGGNELMCQGDIFLSSKNNCCYDKKLKRKVLSKKELLIRLKEYKKKLESELVTVNTKLNLINKLPERR
jgi:hypothetical protein